MTIRPPLKSKELLCDVEGCDAKHPGLVVTYLDENDLIYRLRKRAEIRRQIPTRKSVQEGQPDRLADLLEEAANELEYAYECIDTLRRVHANRII